MTRIEILRALEIPGQEIRVRDSAKRAACGFRHAAKLLGFPVHIEKVGEQEYEITRNGPGFFIQSNGKLRD